MRIVSCRRVRRFSVCVDDDVGLRARHIPLRSYSRLNSIVYMHSLVVLLDVREFRRRLTCLFYAVTVDENDVLVSTEVDDEFGFFLKLFCVVSSFVYRQRWIPCSIHALRSSLCAYLWAFLLRFAYCKLGLPCSLFLIFLQPPFQIALPLR